VICKREGKYFNELLKKIQGVRIRRCGMARRRDGRKN